MKKFILATIIILTSFFVIPKVEADVVSPVSPTFNLTYIDNSGSHVKYGNLSGNFKFNSAVNVDVFNFQINNNLTAKQDYIITYTFYYQHQGTGFLSCKNLENSFDLILTTNLNNVWSTNSHNLNYISCNDSGISMVINVSFTPINDISGVNLKVANKNPLSYPLLDLGFSDMKITFNDTDAAINNQTTIIYNQTNEIINAQEETNNQLNNLNENINNDNTDEATNEASEFFSTFQTDTFGLTSIITAPLTLIQSITSTTCSPLGLPLPYVDETLNLPCLSSIYEEHFGVFLDIYQTITFGIVAYWVCVRIFNLVKDFKNPEHDEIEVLDL